MTPYYADDAGRAVLHHCDCMDGLRAMPDCSVDAVVSDPPYGLSFMGKKWDYDVPSVEIWAECLRVLKPGGHLLAFAGTRTQHRMACRIEDAGFEIRDMVSYLYSTNETARRLIETLTSEQLKLLDATFGRDGMMGWGFGSGFPKSANVSKMIDKAAGAEREVVGNYAVTRDFRGRDYVGDSSTATRVSITAPATDAARQWNGFGTALKPALEPITMARKPLCGTVAANILAHGCGGINVDGCRVGMDGETPTGSGRPSAGPVGAINPGRSGGNGGNETSPIGRWPANLIHDGSAEVVALFPVTTSGKGVPGMGDGKSKGLFGMGSKTGTLFGDSGSAARFFKTCPPDPLDAPDAVRLRYEPKASKRDRDEGCEGLEERRVKMNNGNDAGGDPVSDRFTKIARNHHPTVKPTDLMRYLCRLVTPPGGIVLDPFMGSGSTGKAAILEGFRFVGMERDIESVIIAVARVRFELAAARRMQQEVMPI